MAFQSISSLSSGEFTSCSAAEPRLMLNFVTNNLFSALHTHDKMILWQSCSHANKQLLNKCRVYFLQPFHWYSYYLRGSCLELG